jgi:hypothetical protein
MDVDTTQPLTPKEIKCIQVVLGTLLYYARAVDPTLLAALSAIASQQANGTRAVADACQQLLNYVTTHPNAAFATKLATWYYWYTQMPPSFLNLVVKAERQDTCTYQIVITKTSTMAPYSHCQQSSNTTCHQHPRPHSLHCTTNASLMHHFEPLSRNLATSSQLPLPSPPTTSLPKA